MPEPVDTPIPATQTPARPKLLFVDDERRILVSLKSIFRDHYEVRITTSGAEALEILREWPADVIISDQRMPEIPGVEVLKGAAEIRPATTRILLTGYSDLEAIIGSVNESEVFRFVSKPWKRDDLNRTMAAAVAQARHTQSDGSVSEPVAATPAPAPTQQNGAEVLVLDSNSAERQALVHTLSSEWRLHAAGTIDEALSCIRDHPDIGVVLTESVFEGGAVTALVNALRRARPELVYIVITHEPDAGHIIDLINFGRIYRVLRKPLRASVLRGAVNVANHRHQQLRRDPERAQRLAGSVDAMPEHGSGASLFTRIRTLLGIGRSRTA